MSYLTLFHRPLPDLPYAGRSAVRRPLSSLPARRVIIDAPPPPPTPVDCLVLCPCPSSSECPTIFCLPANFHSHLRALSANALASPAAYSLPTAAAPPQDAFVADPPPLARARQIRCTPPPTLFHRCFVRHHRAIDHRCLFIYIIERLIGRNPLLPPRRHPPLPLPPPPHANTRARCRGMAYLCCIPWRQAMQRIGTLLARRHHIMYYCQLRKSLSTCSFSWLDLFDFLLCQIIELITCRNLIVLMVWYLPILVHRAIG